VKLSEYAQRNGNKYRAAWNRFKAGKIEGAYLDESGHVVVPDPQHALVSKAAVRYGYRLTNRGMTFTNRGMTWSAMPADDRFR